MVESSVRLLPLGPHLGAQVEGIDVRDGLGGETIGELRRAWLRHGLLVFRNQSLDASDLLAFTRCFGEPVIYTRSENAAARHPEVLVLSNRKVEGKPIGAAISSRYWHTDGHFLQEPPAGTFLHGVDVPPEGADTWFCNMAAAYASLAPALRREIDGRTFIMDRVQTLPYHYPDRAVPGPEQKLLWPDMHHPVVRTHPDTGVQALYIGGLVPWRIVGMEPSQSDALMARLHAAAFDERFCWRHRWQPGDLLMWDNRTLSHRATAYDMQRYTRTMLRTTIAGDRPYYRADAIAPARAS